MRTEEIVGSRESDVNVT